uniref:Uncharacterized protein n=1 Tax=Neolamprologus brichardi TaxID=32507 RepID=A0A3Q4GZ26_NEOBR
MCSFIVLMLPNKRNNRGYKLSANHPTYTLVHMARVTHTSVLEQHMLPSRLCLFQATHCQTTLQDYKSKRQWVLNRPACRSPTENVLGIMKYKM